MVGMNLVFHILAAGTLVGLVYFILLLQKERTLLASLFNEAAFVDKARLRLEKPNKFLQLFASSLGVTYEESALANVKVARIKADLLGKVFVEHGICKIKCEQENDNFVVEFMLGPQGNEASAKSSISEALGGAVTVKTGVTV